MSRRLATFTSSKQYACKCSFKNLQLHIALYSVSTHKASKSELSFVSKMDSAVYIQLIFLCVVNIIFAFPGIVSNALVIASFWKSSQRRKKVCHFMIMVLSCFDLIAVVTNHTGMLLYIIFWLREDYDLLPTCWMYADSVVVFLPFSFHVLLVINVERYLGVYYPVFHRTSVTRRRLLTLLAILLIFQIILHVISINEMIISRTLVLIIFIILVFPILVYINFKLFKISREVRGRKAILSEKRATINLKSISTCLLAVGCVVVLSIPASIYLVFNISSENKPVSNARLSYIWSTTCYTINCTLNSLIFFWKSKVLRTEGVKILKTLKDRLVGS